MVKDDYFEIDDAANSIDDAETKFTTTRAKTLLRDIGIEKDIQECIEGIRTAGTRPAVGRWKLKLEALLKVVTIHKTAAEVSSKNAAVSASDGNNVDEVRVSLKR